MRKSHGMDVSNITDSSTADELQGAADDVRRKFYRQDGSGFAKLVKDSLYDGAKLSPGLMRTDLLIAIGAMLAGSRRGNVSRVLTFNFDSTLEWYLSLYGLVPRVVLDPTDHLEGAEDVRIYHPHGFLAHPDLRLRDSDFVLLGLKSINKRLGTVGDPWFELTRHTLQTGTAVFVGLSFRSFEDRAIAPLLEDVGAKLTPKRPTGFWVCVRESDEFKGIDTAIEEARQSAAFLDSNIVPVFVDTYAEVPLFLLSICQAAAKGILV
jgi:hypothetical protein